jgi:3-methylcrotonyl-CoA carboxylase alpha subunit
LTEGHGGADLRRAMLGAAALVGAGLTPAATAGFTLWQPLEQTIALEGEGGAVTVQFRLSHGGKRADLSLDGHHVAARWTDAGWQIEGQPRFETVSAAGEVFVFAPGVTLECRIVDPLDREAAAGAGSDVALSPMPGLVRAVLVTAGQAVVAGERLAVLEAMKMEHALTAGRAGVVAEVLCAAGDQVEAGAILVRLEPEAEA